MFFLFLQSINSVRKRKKIHIVFRMDDYSAVSNIELECKLIEIFAQKEIEVTFGVVPFVCDGDEKNSSRQNSIPLTKEKTDILVKAIKIGVVYPALHGFSHQTNNSIDYSEFKGLAYDEQLNRLIQGKKFLEKLLDKTLDIFIPPWNQYDINTLRALEKAGFALLSAGWKGDVFKESKIKFIPVTCDLKLIREAIKNVRKSSDEIPILVILFHHYDFIEHDANNLEGITLQDFSTLLDWLKCQSDLIFTSFSKLNETKLDISASRFIAVERWRNIEKFLPDRLREKKPILFYHDGSIFYRTLIRSAIFYMIITLCSGLFAFFIGTVFSPLAAAFAKEAVSGFIFTAIGLVIYALRDLDVSLKGLITSFAAIGVATGFYLALI